MTTFFINMINFILLLAIVYGLYKANQSHPLRRLFLPLLIVKLLAGIGLGLVFLWHYKTGDTINYFKEASRYAALAHQDFLIYLKELWNDNASSFQSIYYHQPRALLMTKITSVFVLITGGNYWITSFYFSLFSFAGLWYLSAQIYKVYRNKLAIVIALFLFPSLLFWTAGISKESITIASLSLCFGILFKYNTDRRSLRLGHLILFIISAWVTWEFKYYYAAILMLVSTATVFTRETLKILKKDLKFGYQVGLFTLIAAAAAYLLTFLHPNFYLDRVAQVIVDNHDAFIAKSDPVGLIHFNDLQPHGLSLLQNAPLALISGLFRPWLYDGQGWFYALAIVENLCLVVLTILALPKMFSSNNENTKWLIFIACVYCFILAIFLALSTPNFGTLVRYKTGFLPVLLLLITLGNPLIKKLNYWAFKE